MICLLVMTDGRRDCIEQTLASFDQHVSGPVTRRIIHDDSGAPAYQTWLGETFPSCGIIGGARAGFRGAIDRAWKAISNCPERWVFHLEDDFTFTRDIDLADLATVLDDHPQLVQLALRRQPWSPAEQYAGGIVEMRPHAYIDHAKGEARWLEHQLFFTTNPSLYRTDLCRGGWPLHLSEAAFTQALLDQDQDSRFGFWGGRETSPWVTHIGHERVGTGY